MEKCDILLKIYLHLHVSMTKYPNKEAPRFMQIVKACLRFFGILLLRSFLGIVVAYLWLFAVAYLFHIIMDVGIPRDILDHFYDTGPPIEYRYHGKAAEAYSSARQVGVIGAQICLAAGGIWGFSQGKLDIRRWFRKRHA